MNEAELVYQYGENIGAFWSLMQWWASISFGVLALAHFMGKRLNLAFLAGTLVLYVTFSLMMFMFLGAINETQDGVVSALEKLGNAEGLSDAGASIVTVYANWQSGGLLLALSIMGFFLGAICYPVYVYVRLRRSTN